MKNTNALIAMAHMSENANNPYKVFCEYIKYCIGVNATDMMTITEVADAVCKEFGLCIPYNIVITCLRTLKDDNVIRFDNHSIRRIEISDTEEFEKLRLEYKRTEDSLLIALLDYAKKYNRLWNRDYARTQLINVLDKNKVAYDIFLNKKPNIDSIDIDITELEKIMPDDEEQEDEHIETSKHLFTDENFVGKFIQEILSGNSIEKDYLVKICEGLMICIGAYQLPSANAQLVSPQIKNTNFYFDTRLLLRLVGCGGDAAVTATKELVRMIHEGGGTISYYTHTLEEMNRAFDEAIRCLDRGGYPTDYEMRLYSSKVKNSSALLSAKKANLQNELAAQKIYMREYGAFTDAERIKFGFDREDLKQYMSEKLDWELRTIDNDARSIWETHMNRKGIYSEYCGTQKQLSVFVTSNAKLFAITLGYGEKRNNKPCLKDWSYNRLPVITDVRLTCRLWSPANDGERLSLLYLTANAVAAQRPTKHYLNSIRELATAMEEQVPEYSSIALPEYFDDRVTEAIFQKTIGGKECLDIATLASTLHELTEWKAKEQEDITIKRTEERDEARAALNLLKKDIIDDAVEKYKKQLGINRFFLFAGYYWDYIIGIFIAGVGGLVSWYTGILGPVWCIAGGGGIVIFERLCTSNFVFRWFAKLILPRVERAVKQRINRRISRSEEPYYEEIVERVFNETKIIVNYKERIAGNHK